MTPVIEQPHWLKRLKRPLRVIAGRVEDCARFAGLFGFTRNHVFHYSSPGHARTVKTVMPFILIESKPDDMIAAFCADKVLAAVYAEGNSVIRIPQAALQSGQFDDATSMVASTLVEIARKKERELRKPKSDLRLTQVSTNPIASGS